MPGKAKGSILIYAREHIVRQLGERTWKTILSDLDPVDRSFFDGVPLAAAWYPVAHWNRLMRVSLPLLGRNPQDGMRELAGHIAQRDLNSVYKLVMKLGSPEFLLRRTGQIWSRYYDAGALEPREIEPRRWHLVLAAPTRFDDAPDAYTCGPGVSAWIENGLHLSGTKAKVVETKCRFKTGHQCEYDVVW